MSWFKGRVARHDRASRERAPRINGQLFGRIASLFNVFWISLCAIARMGPNALDPEPATP